MNRLIVIYIALTLLMVTQTKSAKSQYEYRLPAGIKAIPEVVQSTFSERYPDVLLKSWYITHISYWQNDVSAGWYSDWYGERTIVVNRYEKPTYFEVEFVEEPGELSRSMYNLYGYWYETRTKVNGLPQAVNEALRSAGFEAWKISATKEKIESPSWPLAVYRFRISKGLKAQMIRIDEKGEIIQERYLDYE
ncbi:MAG: hypothetical protein HKN45_01335 [Flavobacteriales bacterium]|nr:hypothetical protein [Flavobacteriales bacterium]NNK81285.1 hypothetical protein [Flavobacteriales bacterium]